MTTADGPTLYAHVRGMPVGSRVRTADYQVAPSTDLYGTVTTASADGLRGVTWDQHPAITGLPTATIYDTSGVAPVAISTD